MSFERKYHHGHANEEDILLDTLVWLEKRGNEVVQEFLTTMSRVDLLSVTTAQADKVLVPRAFLD